MSKRALKTAPAEEKTPKKARVEVSANGKVLPKAQAPSRDMASVRAELVLDLDEEFPGRDADKLYLLDRFDARCQLGGSSSQRYSADPRIIMAAFFVDALADGTLPKHCAHVGDLLDMYTPTSDEFIYLHYPVDPADGEEKEFMPRQAFEFLKLMNISIETPSLEWCINDAAAAHDQSAVRPALDAEVPNPYDWIHTGKGRWHDAVFGGAVGADLESRMRAYRCYCQSNGSANQEETLAIWRGDSDGYAFKS